MVGCATTSWAAAECSPGDIAYNPFGVGVNAFGVQLQYGCQEAGRAGFINVDDPNDQDFGQLGTLYTLDQNGNQDVDENGNPIPPMPDTGAVTSWINNSYVDPAGSISEALNPQILTADASFIPVVSANPSKNDVALQRCAPLDSTTNGSLENAYSSLITFLRAACVFCQNAIWQQLNISNAEFESYLTQGHEFCDGTKSQEPGGSIGASEKTVAQYFQNNIAPPTSVDAVAAKTGFKPLSVKLLGVFTLSSSERRNLKVFFAPVNIANNDLPTNESLEFHEALHGFSGLGAC